MRGSQVRLLPEIQINASVAQRIPFRQSLFARHSSNKFGSALAYGDLEHPTSNGRAASLSLAGSTDIMKALTECSLARLSKPSLLCLLQEKFKFMLYFGEDIPKFICRHNSLELSQLVEGIRNEIAHIGVQW